MAPQKVVSTVALSVDDLALLMDAFWVAKRVGLLVAV